MKKVSIKYGKTELEIELSDHATILTPRYKPPERDEAEILTESLDDPIDSPKLENFVHPADKVLIIVPDKTRKARVDFVLKFALQRIKSKKIKILFANGTHSKQSEIEKREILGDEIYNNFEILENDAYDDNFTYYGKTSRGTEILLNKLVSSSDKILVIGAITHHYFAGFGGGAKMLVPGVSSYKTSIQNHKLTLTPDGDLNPNATNLKLDGNPVYEDIVEAFKLCNLKAFHIGVVLDENDKIISAFSGELISSHRVGTEFVKKFLTIPVSEKFDAIISSAGGFPKDVNFIQSHKAIHHSHYIVKEGGRLFCFIECRDGIGSKTFLNWFNFKNLDEMKKQLLQNYSMNGHTALSLQNKLKIANISVKSKLGKKLIELMGLESFDELDILGKLQCSIAVIKNASVYLPIYAGTHNATDHF